MTPQMLARARDARGEEEAGIIHPDNNEFAR
jgi:hypothetical protein